MMSTQVRLAGRNAFRRPVRTMLTTCMVVGGVALLLVLLTWIQGATGQILGSATMRGGHVRVVDPDFAAREQLAPLDEHVPQAAALADALAKHPGVVAVEPRIATGATITAGEEIGEVFGRVVGARPSYFDRIGARDKLVEGKWFSGGADEIVAGATVVREAGARVGDELLLLGATQDGAMSPVKGALVGIVGGDGELNQMVLVPLAKAQWMADVGEGATEVLVYGARYEDASALAASLRAAAATQGYAVEAWTERDPWRNLAATIRGMQSAIVMVVVFLVALGIWNTMTMSVLERTHEIGVLRALGMTRFGTVGMFVGEAAAIGLLGGALGVALGAVPSWLLQEIGVTIGKQAAESSNELALSEVIHGDLTARGALSSFLLGLVMAAAGSVIPALRAASIQPVVAMRSGR